METGHLIVGTIGAFWSGAMIYFAGVKEMPALVKPFLFTWRVEDEKVNRFIGLVLGISGMIGSLVLISAGWTSRKILPFL